MGYYTKYNLKTKPYKEGLIQELLDEENAYGIDEDGNSTDSVKWYGHETDLREFSKEHPDILFILEGEGEENDDLWILYVKNGKSQRCRPIITYEEFDEKKLK
jgi:hypothetical protein